MTQLNRQHTKSSKPWLRGFLMWLSNDVCHRFCLIRIPSSSVNCPREKGYSDYVTVQQYKDIFLLFTPTWTSKGSEASLPSVSLVCILL